MIDCLTDAGGLTTFEHAKLLPRAYADDDFVPAIVLTRTHKPLSIRTWHAPPSGPEENSVVQKPLHSTDPNYQCR